MSLNTGSLALRRVGVGAIIALLSCATFAWGSDLRVPQQFTTIQAAIDSASPGDTILLAKGTYKGPGNVNLDTRGKALKIQGAGYLGTIIDCERNARGFVFQNGETSSTEVRSLTIQNGRDSLGGAILVTGASPAILYCSFNDCTADFGGAVAVQAGNPGLVGCQFVNNRALQGGGAVYTYNSSSTLSGNVFNGNETQGKGGAVAMEGGSLFIVSCNFKDNTGDQGGGAFFSLGGDVALVNGSFSVNTANVAGGAVNLTGGTAASITNCTFGANLSRNGAGALQTDNQSHASVSNSIMWSDGSKEFAGDVNIRFSCVAGGATGDGNTSDDPRIVDAIDHDLHIRVGSACIDKADKNLVIIAQDQDGRARSIGSGPDMGAYEYPIVRPTAEVAAEVDNVFQVPHDGNPDTDSVLATVHGSAFDWLQGTLAYLWTCDDKVLGSTPTLSLALEPGEQVFNLQVRDVGNGIANQKVHVKVLSEQNSAPVANAGSDQRFISNGAPVHIALHGNGYDADGDTLTYNWSPSGSTSQDLEMDLVPGNYYYTLTVRDPYGATGKATIWIHVADGLGPKVVLNGDNPYYLEVFDPWLEPGATATDDVDGSDLVVKIYGSVDNNKLGTYQLVYAATDSSGNTGSTTRQVIVRDTKAPVITLVGDNPMTVDCKVGYTEPGATAEDNYDGPVPVDISGATTSAPGTYAITYTASDSSGNISTVVRTVIVADVDGPVIVLNGDNPMTIECSQGYVEPGATATDGCLGVSLPVTITGTVGTTPGSYTITYSATNASGLTATKTRTVIVKDTIAPIITLNGDNPMDVECGSGYNEPGATAVDACEGTSIPVVITGTVLTTKGTYTVTYKATDAAGNTSTVTRTVIVADTQPPVITLIGANPMSVECGNGYVEPGATATDVCDGTSIPVVITGSVLTTKGSYTITYKATDSSGNTATVTRTVNVVDTEPPVITLNGLSTITNECATGYTEFGATATDICDGAVTVQITGTVPSTKGTYTVTYKATDSSGNTATATRTVNVIDTTPPVLTINGANPMNVECGSGYSEPGATATDTCDGNVNVVITGTVSTGKGTYVRTYTATDSSGNSTSGTRTINVTDGTPPVITLLGANPMTVECGSGYVEPGATATDSCDPSVTITITGTVPTNKGTYIVTYKATDSSGNFATATRTVNVTDTKPPVITLLGSNPMTVQCGSGYPEPGATAADICDGTITVVITGTVPAAVGSYTVTYKATDSSGNQATLTRTVNVVDTVGPVITLNGNNPMDVDCKLGYNEPGASALDACDGVRPVTITGSVPSSAGTYTVTYTSSDTHGNTTIVTRTVTVTSKVPPSANNFNATPTGINNNGNLRSIQLHYGFGQHCAAYTWDITCTSSDPDSGVFPGDKPGDIVKIDRDNWQIRGEKKPGGARTYTFTLTVTDVNGNTASYTTTVNVN